MDGDRTVYHRLMGERLVPPEEKEESESDVGNKKPRQIEGYIDKEEEVENNVCW